MLDSTETRIRQEFCEKCSLREMFFKRNLKINLI
jgi:hypothetical protein